MIIIKKHGLESTSPIIERAAASAAGLLADEFHVTTRNSGAGESTGESCITGGVRPDHQRVRTTRSEDFRRWEKHIGGVLRHTRLDHHHTPSGLILLENLIRSRWAGLMGTSMVWDCLFDRASDGIEGIGIRGRLGFIDSKRYPSSWCIRALRRRFSMVFFFLFFLRVGNFFIRGTLILFMSLFVGRSVEGISSSLRLGLPHIF